MNRSSHHVFHVLIMFFLSLLLASCESTPSTSTEPAGPLAEAFQSHLLLVKDALAAIVDPGTVKATTIPDFDTLFQAAGRLDLNQNPGKEVATILALLGRASDFDATAPGPDYALQFPKDHHLHPTMGFEWYYVCFYLNVTDPDGVQGRIGVLVSMQKQRVLGLSTQRRFGWSDEKSMLFVNLATATLDFPGRKAIIRRRANLQWPAAGGSARYSALGEPFNFECGPDRLSGTSDVLPLLVSIQDGTNLSFSLTAGPPDGFEAANAFFLQGLPTSIMGQGTGLTSFPTPGIYYSWPQLVVDTSTSPSIVVDGVSYTVNSGKGWMDHQLMMQSLRNAGDSTSPIPFTDDPKPVNGWSWQFFNLDNGDAFTGAAFHQWYLSVNPSFSYGYYVTPNRTTGKWDSIFINGELLLGDFKSFTALVGTPSSPLVLLPNSWKYANVQSVLGDPLQGNATPWFTDGTFNSQSLQVIGENPVDYRDTSGRHPNGVGFCESIGFERSDSYRKRALDSLGR